MSSKNWYYDLIVIGVIALAFTMHKKRNIADLVSFFFATAALTALCEYFVLFLFKGYVYKPEIFKANYADIIIGHIIPNISIWGAATVMVGALSLRNQWIFLISIGFMLIEILFLKLDIYEQRWWKTYYTGILAFVFLYVSKIWYCKLERKRHKFLRSITFFFVAFGLIQFPTSMFLIFEKHYYAIGWVQDKYLDTILFTFIYDAWISLLYIVFVCILQKWYWKLIPAIIFFLSNSMLVYLNILIFQDGWNLFYLSIIHTVGFLIFILLEKHSFKLTSINS